MQGKSDDQAICERRTYRNPPIEEAVCEFRFKPSQDWDLTIPGKLQAEISGDYTGRPQEQRVIDVAFRTAGRKPPELKYGEGLAKVQLVTNDGKRKVGVGQDVLSIHMLRPYQQSADVTGSGWEEFRPRIEEALDAYWKVAAPEGVSRIGIRYINKIVVSPSGGLVRIEDYLNCAPPDVKGLPDHMIKYVSRAEYSYGDGARLILSHGTVKHPPGSIGFLLDIDVISEMSTPVDSGKALEIVNDLRKRERDAFEKLITKTARELFDAD